jgi:hypothetical protein
VNRRRRQASERQAPEQVLVQPRPVVTPTRTAVAIPRTAPAQARPAPRPMIARALPATAQAVDVVIAEVVPAEQVRGRTPLSQSSDAPVVDVQASAGRPTPETTVRALQRGVSLFHSPESLQAAWLAGEILGPPRCRRNGL